MFLLIILCQHLMFLLIRAWYHFSRSIFEPLLVLLSFHSTVDMYADSTLIYVCHKRGHKVWYLSISFGCQTIQRKTHYNSQFVACLPHDIILPKGQGLIDAQQCTGLSFLIISSGLAYTLTTRHKDHVIEKKLNEDLQNLNIWLYITIKLRSAKL